MGRTPVHRIVIVAVVAVVSALLAAAGVPAGATHSWAGYHWARTANPFTLRLGDNVSGPWDDVLATTSADWSTSGALDTTVVPGEVNPKRCPATTGMVQVCNAAYGRNGWLGIAQVWVSGGHIAKGIVKLNDTYYSTATYDTVAWRNLVSCQEVGHTLGLDHQDEAFDNPNLGSCMDYTRSPASNQHPNQHDYDQLDAIYLHTDSTTTVGAAPAASPGPAAERATLDVPGAWGRLVSGAEQPGAVARYVRDLGGGEAVFTFVVWA